jgi:hypothetical protein
LLYPGAARVEIGRRQHERARALLDEGVAPDVDIRIDPRDRIGDRERREQMPRLQCLGGCQGAEEGSTPPPAFSENPYRPKAARVVTVACLIPPGGDRPCEGSRYSRRVAAVKRRVRRATSRLADALARQIPPERRRG